MEHPDEIDLTVTVDIYTCKEVIKQLGNKPPMLSSPLRPRMVSTVAHVGPKLAIYRIYKRARGHRRAYSPPVVILQGELKAKSDNQTRLQGRARINWVGYAFGVITAVVFGYVSSGVLAYAFFQSSIVMQALILLVILLSVYGISRFEIKRSKTQLLNSVMRAFSEG